MIKLIKIGIGNIVQFNKDFINNLNPRSGFSSNINDYYSIG